jgi:RNA polymerase sigma factor (sigma-70 family)
MRANAAAAFPWDDTERRRLVRLCALLSGDRDAAEDLAQETLLEAWRNRHKLHDPSGANRWLSAIARNVCLRRSRRRTYELLPEQEAPAQDDLELELERGELAELLDRALGLLTPETREALVHRYVHDSPHAEIAARLGVSEEAVSMRLGRGKVVLRRVLAGELRDEAEAYGLVDDDGWRETRVWCPACGRRTLLSRRQPAAAELRCPSCSPEAPSSRLPLRNPHFARLVGGVVRPTAIAARAAEWAARTFAGGAGSEVACTRCARPVRVERHELGTRAGLHASCRGCGEQVSSSLAGIALGRPAVKRLRADQRRVHALPPRRENRAGVPAVVVRFEALLGSAGADVAFARDTFSLLD